MQRSIFKHWSSSGSSAEKKVGEVYEPGWGDVKAMKGQFTEIANLSSCELMKSGPNKQHAYVGLTYNVCMCLTNMQLGLFVRVLTVSLRHVPSTYLAFGNLFLVVNYLTQPRHRGRSLALPYLDVPCFIQAHARPALLSEWRWMRSQWGRGRWEARERKGNTGGRGNCGPYVK